MKLPLVVRFLLWPLSQLYGMYARVRRALYEAGWLKSERLKAVVISIGNVTIGGTGKTPMVLWLAERLLAQGKRVGILTRGYKGAHGSSDEVELLKRRLGGKVVFGVAADRFASGSRLETQQQVDVFLLDDGFQHLQLARDLDIVMVDGSRELDKEWLLPAGSLREPISACREADILVVTRKAEGSAIKALDSAAQPILFAQTRLIGFHKFGFASETKDCVHLGPGPFVAFCGIGNPAAFFDDLSRWQVPIVEKKVFPDHHKYSSIELEQLQAHSVACGAAGLVTTEKDAENLPSLNVCFPIWIAVIDLVVDAERELLGAIDRKLSAGQGAAA
jgi:tetraacyldisaccharide 4'-kinase